MATKRVDPWTAFLQGLADDPYTRAFTLFPTDKRVVEARIKLSGTVADLIAEMARLHIPLSAEIVADTEYEENGPEVFLRWYIPAEELPPPSRKRGS